MKLSAHFTTEELNCKCGCGATVHQELVNRLEILRVAYKRPVRINSGARCKAHNAAINGAALSWHISGLAVDIPVANSNERYALIEAAIASDFSGIGVREDIVHLDLRPVEKPILFLYKDQ